MASPFESLHPSWHEFDQLCTDFPSKHGPIGCIDPATPEQYGRRNSTTSSFGSEPGLTGSTSSFSSTHTQPSTPGYDDFSPREYQPRIYQQYGLGPQTPRAKVMQQDRFHESSPLSQTEFGMFADQRIGEFDMGGLKMPFNTESPIFRQSAAEPFRFELDTMAPMSCAENTCTREPTLPSSIAHLPSYIPGQFGHSAPPTSHTYFSNRPTFETSFTSIDSDMSGSSDWSSSPSYNPPGHCGTVGLAAIENAMSTSRSLRSVVSPDLDAAPSIHRKDSFDIFEYEDDQDSSYSPSRKRVSRPSPIRPSHMKAKVKKNRKLPACKRNQRRDQIQVLRGNNILCADKAQRGNQICKDCGKRFDRAEHLKRHENSTACGGRVKEAINPCLLDRFCQMNRGNSEPKYFGSRGDNRNQHHITHLGWYDNKTGSKTRNTIVTHEDALFLVRRNGGPEAAQHFEESVALAYEKRIANVEDFKIGEPHQQAKREIQRLREQDEANASMF